MASALDRLNAATAKRGNAPAAAPVVPDVVLDDPQVPMQRPVRTDPVRSTVDLSPTHHDRLGIWVDEASVALGLPIGRRGVTRQDVMAALVAEVLTDEVTSRKVRARISKGKAQAKGNS